MAFNIDLWQRFEHEGVPIYVRPDRPDWFVPSSSGDATLKQLQAAETAPGDADLMRFVQRLPQGSTREYPGRSHVLKLAHLRELWLHITDECDLACRHCLFASSPQCGRQLSVHRVLDLADQAVALGCRVFALTGGEPFVHPGFAEIVDGLLAHEEAHVAVLTNGMKLKEKARLLERWPNDRFHLQVSLDGTQEHHDHIRGPGNYSKLAEQLTWLQGAGKAYTVSMCVEHENVDDMADVVAFAADNGAANVHFMWYFVRGRGKEDDFVLPDRIFTSMQNAAERAEARGVTIDNIEALKTQVFAPAGTIHDGSNSGWESVAVGSDGRLYPSPALVGLQEMATPLSPGLEAAWKESPVLRQLRNRTAAAMSDPLRFLLGGGDPDHAYMNTGSFGGRDPYRDLHGNLVLWLISRRAREEADTASQALRLKMGDVLESCGAHGNVALIHSNCLLALAHEHTRSVVKEFYQQAAADRNPDILNPVGYPDNLMAHIPPRYRFRGYGCGSPVLDAVPAPGEVVVDLGCGTGTECFLAAPLVGPRGRVIGIDMLENMLERADEGGTAVAENLGFDNLDFRKGYLEELPLETNTADVVLSNCVLNLTVDKRKSFREILRALKPGGRLVVSDVVADREPDAAIRNDDHLRGECIAGALTQRDLFGILDETGFTSIRIHKRFPYRTVRGHPFFSITYEARKPAQNRVTPFMYKGPFPAVVTPGGTLLRAGITCEEPLPEWFADTAPILTFNEAGQALNVDPSENSCCSCAAPAEDDVQAETQACCCGPETAQIEAQNLSGSCYSPASEATGTAKSARHRSGCMVCGRPLTYFTAEKDTACAYCGTMQLANATCAEGHFVCDRCHSRDGSEVIRTICLHTRETDMLALMTRIRSHPAIPLHGPEHHIMVPGIILATYRNLGGRISDDLIRTGLDRGARVPGGYCGYMGICGAAIGVGIAFALLLESTPLKGVQRHQLQSLTHEVLGVIAQYEAARCCQRDCWLALKKAADMSATLLPIHLRASAHVACRQIGQNGECLGKACPLFPADFAAAVTHGKTLSEDD